MKQALQVLLKAALLALEASGELPCGTMASLALSIEYPRDAEHGDYACGVAMALGKQLKQNPRVVAQKIIDSMPASTLIGRMELAGPGYINFFLSNTALHASIQAILQQQDQYGRSQQHSGKKLHIELLSANPTGPLHVGHGRLAAYGATTANLLAAVGYSVHAEYYVNDAGRQMDILALSIWLRYLELMGEIFTFPAQAYQGDYVMTMAKALKVDVTDHYAVSAAQVFADNEPVAPRRDAPDSGAELGSELGSGLTADELIDNLIARGKQLLGVETFSAIRERGLKSVLADIQEDLDQFGVTHHEWYLESQLEKAGLIDQALDALDQHKALYQQDGALWFRATDYGDEKDRVVRRANGAVTYFAADIAYHLGKITRGFDRMVDVFGADHHGYMARMRAFFTAMGKDPDQLDILLVQFAILYRGKTRVSMSTRAGSFVTLRELREEVGNDAARYFYVMRKRAQHLDFDLELAKAHANENPVYYVQYAHARIASVRRQCLEKKLGFDQVAGLKQLGVLQSSQEKQLMCGLSRYPETVTAAAAQYEPHVIVQYLQQMAGHFHSYYNAVQVLVDDKALREARLCLLLAVQQVLKNGLTLLGVSAPDEM